MSKQKSRKIKAVSSPLLFPGLMPTPPAIHEPEEQILPRKTEK